MNKPFTIKYNWDDFDNTWGLSEFQKHRIKRLFRKESKNFIQNIIDESVRERHMRRADLNAHIDPDDPFRLDIGGEG